MSTTLKTTKPLLWSAAFLMIALIAGCGGGGGSGSTPDTTAPTVTSVAPRGSSIATNTNVSAIFSEDMDSSTINATTFTLQEQGLTPNLDGAVSYTDRTAKFTPASPLVAGTTYIATVTTGVKDLAGNALGTNKTWTFTPSSLTNNGPEPVDLGTAGDFVILSKAGITTTGDTAVTGDLGVSPIAASSLTGFAQALDGTGTFSTSSLVTGSIYAADYSPPTPAKLTTAVSDMESAYTDAAGRTSPAPVVNVAAGLLGGQNLAPRIYTFTNNVLISGPLPLTLTGNASDVWIFQIPGTLTVANGVIVTLTGAEPKNVFWQVAGATTIGTTAQMKGVILGATAIVVQNGATVNGRLLSQTAVTLDASTVEQPAP